MKKYRVWIGLAVLCVIVGVPQLFWKPSRFGGIFLLALAIGIVLTRTLLQGKRTRWQQSPFLLTASRSVPEEESEPETPADDKHA